jgi:hypothetical protein
MRLYRDDRFDAAIKGGAVVLGFALPALKGGAIVKNNNPAFKVRHGTVAC